LRKICDSLAWNCEVPFFRKFFLSHFEQFITHYRWTTTSLFIVNISSPIFEHCTPLSYSSCTRYILAINRRA
jgi:hypothetical protein